MSRVHAQGQSCIGHLFLIRDECEYNATNKIIQSKHIDDNVILSIDDKYPYLVDKYPNFSDVSRWEEFDVNTMEYHRYFLDKYNDIEEVIRNEARNLDGYEEEIANSPHFTLGAVWKLGVKYYQYIALLDSYFNKFMPENVYLNSSKDFMSELFVAFIRLHNKKHYNIPR